MQRIAPTPDNYQRIYNEIAGLPHIESLEEAMARALKQLPRDRVENIKWISGWEKLLSSRNWKSLPLMLVSEMEQKVAQAKRWPDAIRDLLRNWDGKRSGLTQQRKKEALERVLINFANDPSLPEKIQAMSRSWSEYKASEDVVLSGTENESQAGGDQASGHSPESNNALPGQSGLRVAALQESIRTAQDMLHLSLQHGLIPRLDGYPELQVDARNLLKLAEKTYKPEDWQLLAKQLKSLFVRVELIGVEEEAIKHDLLSLLKLLIDNISELVSDDQWLRGQIAVVQTIISSPLEKDLIKDAEKSLKEVIFKQGSLKHGLAEAKHNFKHMVATFIERLGTLSDSTGSYQRKVENYHEQLSNIDDIVQINALVENLMQDTREMQTGILRSQDILNEERDRVLATEERMRRLEMELTELSEKVRIDQLTGVLNRRGLEEAFVREIARAERGDSHLGVVLLDIDNFKRLNDQYGHDTGDAALQHLANTIKDSMRPTDIVARFGGEEFVLLLPDTEMNDSVAIVTRLQRELTKRFFLHNNERLLVTFSAGISSYKAGEQQETVLHRADRAMYLAKSTGKNRVLTEDDLERARNNLSSAV